MLVLSCPRCSTTDAVRAEVFGAGFWTELAVLVLPLAFIAMIAAVLHRMGTRTETERS
jgi:uncharacterized membrane protein YhdT